MFFIFVLYSFMPLGNFVLCSLSFEEVKAINYEVDILKTPIKKGEESPLPSLQMKSKYGQLYQCLLPQIDEPEVSDKKDTTAEENIDIKELLKPIQSGSCLLKTKDWWTYEFCYGHYIKQYHIEDGKVIGQEITLGLYESDYNWKNETDKNKFQNVKQRYHSQLYTNGTRCDLTGLPRSAEVRFFCEEDAGDYILRVDEPGTCNYVLTVHTSRICSHPELKALPSSKVHLISCSPLLNEKQYAEYLRKLEEEKTKAAQERSTWLTTQQERLKVMKTWSKTSAPDGEVEGKDSDALVSSEELDKTLSTEEIEANSLHIKRDSQGQAVTFVDTPTLPVQKDDEKENIISKENYKGKGNFGSDTPTVESTGVTDDLRKEFNSILNEAYDDDDLNFGDESKDDHFSKLASTLNMLLEKLDKAEKGVVKAAQELEKMQSYPVSQEHGIDNGDQEDDDSDDLSGKYEELSLTENAKNEYQPEKTKLKMIETDKPRSAVFDDDKLRVRIRRLDRKSSDASGELNQMDLAQRKKLEQVIKEKLEKSGLDTGGRRIEVNIITSGYYDNEDGKDFHSLSDDETNQFQNMIMALLTGQQEAIQEMEKQKKLEENYKFVWPNIEPKKTDDDE